MKSEKESEVQFSIYKVDLERVKDYYLNKGKTIRNFEDFEEEFYSNLQLKYKGNCKIFSYNNFKGIVYKSFYEPEWLNMIKECLESESMLENSKNVHISYILSYILENNMFFMTAGLANNEIKPFITISYGLFLLPKMLKEETPVIKAYKECIVNGGRASNNTTNRMATSIFSETKMDAIFTKLSLMISGEKLLEELDIKGEEKDKKRNISVMSQDSFIIQKTLSLMTLENVLKRLIKIERRADNFILGYLVPAEKENYVNQKIWDNFIEKLKQLNDYEKILIVGEDYLTYLTEGVKYEIKDNNEIILKKDEPITFNDLVQTCIKKEKNTALFKRIFSYRLVVSDESQKKILDLSVKQALQADVEDENGTYFYLYSGKWYVLRKRYEEVLKEEYEKSFDALQKIPEKLIRILKEGSSKRTEDEFNNYFKDHNEIIMTHTAEYNKIEIADLIYCDDKDVYLLHNKQKLDGGGARDVMGQILLSAELLSKMNKDRRYFLELYYEEIKKKKFGNRAFDSLLLDDFVNIFEKKKIHYVAGFMEPIKKDTRSKAVQYFVMNTKDRMEMLGYPFHIINLK